MVTATRPVTVAGGESIPAHEGWATYPALAADDRGRLWVAWLERLDGADGVWLQPSGGAARRLAHAAAIKDGPALAWTAAAGLCCAWQYRADDTWGLAVAVHCEDEAGLEVERIAGGVAARPSHPVLAGVDTRLFLGYEEHRADGAQVALGARRGGEWTAPVTLSGRQPQGKPEAAYDLTLASAGDQTLWAAWVEAREARYDIWVAHAPVDGAADLDSWSTPKQISGGPHLSVAPRLLAVGRDVWVTWANYSGEDRPLLGEPWANGPERRWERVMHVPRRRVHVRRWDAAAQTWGPEWREPEPPAAPSPAANRPPLAANGHWPVLVPLDQSAGSVALLCRRSTRVFRWSIEAYRLQAHADGRLTLSDPAVLAAPDGAQQARAGANMPVAVTTTPTGQTYLAWQQHDRAPAAPGFHFTTGTSSVWVTPFGDQAVPTGAPREPVAVGPATQAPAGVRARAAARTVTIDGSPYRLVFGNLHRHAECSACGGDTNGQAELHMRQAPDVNRNEFLAVTDHGEHLNPGEWREQCVLADFYTWPGTRVALPGIEWTSEAPWHPPAHGHLNVIFSRSDLPYLDCFMPHSDHPRRLWAWLAANDPRAVTIPHHTMRGKAPTLWEHADERFQPVVEIFQDMRGSAEWLGAPAATSTARVQGLGLDPRGSTRRALDRGLRVGFIASSDHGGVALGGLYVKEISRAGILEALRARRCFATTGDRLLLDFRINGVFQGGELVLTEIPDRRTNQVLPLTITLHAEVLRPVQRVVLIRDGVEVDVSTPDAAAGAVDRVWQVEGPFVGTSYFYVRLESADGELAWSSPVWVTRDWGREIGD